MDDSLISLFIDDEMDLDEKIVFVETVHASKPFTEETITLLEQEKLLRRVPTRMPASIQEKLKGQRAFSWRLPWHGWLQPMVGFATAMLLVGLGFLLMPRQPMPEVQTEQRFVLYLPEASQAKIVGTFTDWNPVPMEKIGNSGYWSLSLKVPPGEHRYSYLVEEGARMVDPTIAAREHDDFGGENSVIIVGGGDDPLS